MGGCVNIHANTNVYKSSRCQARKRQRLRPSAVSLSLSSWEKKQLFTSFANTSGQHSDENIKRGDELNHSKAK